jgi:hypothetical protein
VAGVALLARVTALLAAKSVLVVAKTALVVAKPALLRPGARWHGYQATLKGVGPATDAPHSARARTRSRKSSGACG